MPRCRALFSDADEMLFFSVLLPDSRKVAVVCFPTITVCGLRAAVALGSTWMVTSYCTPGVELSQPPRPSTNHHHAAGWQKSNHEEQLC